MIFIGWVWWHINHCGLFNAKSSLYLYIKYIWVLLVGFDGISTLFHINHLFVDYEVITMLLFNSNCSIQHYFFICTQLNCFPYYYVSLTTQLNISHLFSQTLNIKQLYLTNSWNLSDATTPGHSGSGRDCNEWVLCIPQSSSMTTASLLDCLMLYLGHLLVWVFSLSRDAVGVFYSPTPSRLGWRNKLVNVKEITWLSHDFLSFIKNRYTFSFFFFYCHAIRINAKKSLLFLSYKTASSLKSRKTTFPPEKALDFYHTQTQINNWKEKKRWWHLRYYSDVRKEWIDR